MPLPFTDLQIHFPGRQKEGRQQWPDHEAVEVSAFPTLRLPNSGEQTLMRTVDTSVQCQNLPLRRFTRATNQAVQFGYGLNYLINIENAVTVDAHSLSEIWNLPSTKSFPI